MPFLKFKRVMLYMKTSGKDKLVSKEIRENIQGHIYLKAVCISYVNPNVPDPDVDEVRHLAFDVFGDILYTIEVVDFVGDNGKNDKSIDIIFNFFGTVKAKDIRNRP